MTSQLQLLRLLSDGRFRSGQELGAILGVSRAAVWKQLRALEAKGVDVHAVRGKGYRLAEPLELFEHERIMACLDARSRALLQGFELHSELDSTNRHLMRRVSKEPTAGHVCLAECQQAGRGRRGRQWVSPLGRNIYLSVLWHFSEGAARLSGLSLAVAVAVLRALREVGVGDVGVKWPNDILWQRRKLAGILLEMSGESDGPCHVVVGVGLNVRMPPRCASDIDQSWVDLETIHAGISRNRVAGELIRQLLLALAAFEEGGLAPFRDEWLAADALADTPVVLRFPATEVRGLACGVDEVGALLLNVDGKLQRYQSGEVSLRALA
jgi:BirA family biotin operon repressor/biotin-[acetyl-CoA-carboxylase] ligase